MSGEYKPKPEEIEGAVDSARRQMKEWCAENHIFWEESDANEKESVTQAKKEGWEVVDLPGGDLNIGITPETMPDNYDFKVIGFGKTWRVLRRKKTAEKR